MLTPKPKAKTTGTPDPSRPQAKRWHFAPARVSPTFISGTSHLYARIIDEWVRVDASWRGKGKWIISQSLETDLEIIGELVGTAGVPVYQARDRKVCLPPAQLLGRPVVWRHTASAKDEDVAFIYARGEH